MATRYRFGEDGFPHFVTCTVINWIDVFTREEYKAIIIDSLKYCIENKGLEVHGYVIMHNHMHLLISTASENKLQDIVRDFKKYCAQQIIKAIEESKTESRKKWLLWMFERAGKKNPNNKKYQFWAQDNHPIECNTIEMMQQKLDYIHENPVRAGWVQVAEHFKYSSAIDYLTNAKGLLPISYI